MQVRQALRNPSYRIIQGTIVAAVIHYSRIIIKYAGEAIHEQHNGEECSFCL